MSFIKLDRALKDWRYKQFPNYVALWVQCLLEANYEDRKRKDIVVKRGSFITSIEKLKEDTGLTTQQIRTILNNLKDEEITIKSTNKFTLIEVNKYDYYQSQESETNKQITNKQQTNNKQITTTKKLRNKEDIKSIESESKKLEINKQIKEVNKRNKYGEYGNVLLTEEQFHKLGEEYGIEANTYIKFLDEYIEEKSYKSKSHYLAIKRWVINAVNEKQLKKQKIDNALKSSTNYETLPVYEESKNPTFNKERFNELMERRK